MASSLSEEASRLMDEFEKALQSNTVAENCWGLNGFGEDVPFTTKKFLVQYWTYEHVKRLLLSFPGPPDSARDIDLILGEYIIVFSILTKLRKSDWIRKFLQSQIKDKNLPIRTSMPTSWMDQESHRELWESFITEQWAFCPYTFDRILDRLSDAELSESYIFPIQEKVCLKGEVDGGELAVLYRYTVHPAFQNKISEHVVFKEYQRIDSIAGIVYDNEVSIYTTLKPNLTGSTDSTDSDRSTGLSDPTGLKGSAAFKNIIEYYGSFQTRQNRTIMLEYATGGDLSTFFDTLDPPSNVKHLTTFWTSFFELLLGLETVHSLAPAESDNDTDFLQGVHQDIRPQTILLIPKSPRTYSFTFKLMNPGTGYIKKPSLDHLRQRHGDSLSNAIYSSPESINGRMHPESDIWALGALASEMLIWTVQGGNGVRNYLKLRRNTGRMISSLEESHHGCFHDGIRRLSIIDDMHREVLKKIKPDDKISVMVSQFILEHMLVEYPSVLQGDTSSVSPFRQGSTETYRLWQKKLSEVLPTKTRSSNYVEGRLHRPIAKLKSMPATTNVSSQPSDLDSKGARTMGRYSPMTYGNPEEILSRLDESHGLPSVRQDPSQHYLQRNSILHDEESFEGPPTGKMRPGLDRESIIKDLMETMDYTTGGTDVQHHPLRFDNDPVTIEKIYENFIAPKDRNSDDVAALSSLTPSSDDQNELLKVYPALGRVVSGLKNYGSSGGSQIFLIDDSESMRGSRDSVAETVRVLAYLIKNGDVDPDQVIKLYFASQIGLVTQSSNSKPLEDAVKEWEFDDSVCEMGIALESLLLRILSDRLTSAPKPVTVYVLTNGLWLDKKPTSLCGVDEAIEKALRYLDASEFQSGRKWLGVQFIGFFKRQPPAHGQIGRRRLKFLAEKLGDLFKVLGFNFTGDDIVDTREWDDNLKDVLLGPISYAVDGVPKEGRRRFDYVPADHLLQPQSQSTRSSRSVDNLINSSSSGTSQATSSPQTFAGNPHQGSHKDTSLPDSTVFPLSLPETSKDELESEFRTSIEYHVDIQTTKNASKDLEVGNGQAFDLEDVSQDGEDAESNSSEVSSILSDFSSLSSLTSSGSMANPMVAERIAKYLLEDDEIGPLFCEAPITAFADLNKAQSELIRSLRKYGRELYRIARPGLQRNIAAFVKYGSKNIAQMMWHLEQTHGGNTLQAIKKNFPEPQKAEKQQRTGLYLESEATIGSGIEKEASRAVTVGSPGDESDDEPGDETEDENSDELQKHFQDHLMEAKQFLRTEQPLNNLIQRLRKLVSSREQLDTTLEATEEQFASEPLTTIPKVSEEESIFELEPYHTTTSVIESRTGAFPNFPSLVDWILNALISHNYEPLVPEGMQRVRWVCNHCGTKLFDDFEIADPSVMRNLEDQLRANNTDQNGRMNKLKHVIAQVMGEVLNFVSSIVTQRQATSLQDSLDLQRRIDSAARQQRGQTVRNELYLLLCVDTGDFNTRLLQSGMQHVKDDHALFDHLRQTYYESQNPSRWFTLRSVNSLHLRRFKLDFSDYTETHKHEDQCQRLDCICLPPKEYVGTEPGKEYRCSPAPQRQGTEPAIGCNRLTHYFYCAGAPKIGQTTILEQLPKRTCGKLSASEHQEVLGWGIHFEEGWHWRTIKVLVVFFSLSSSAFGIVWTFIRGDMSGAFTVSGWWMALGAGLLSFLALRSKTQ